MSDGSGPPGARLRRGPVFGPSAVLTPANVVTALRLLASPLAFTMMMREADHSSWPLAGLWFVLSMTDMVDGRLARKYGSTRSGAFLDPLADKVLVLGGVGAMCVEGRFPWVAWVLIALREAAISAFRAGYVRKGLAVPASKLAKWKAFVQLAAVGWVTLPWTNGIRWLADATLWIGVVVGLVSGAQYLVAGRGAATTMEPPT
ncbi:MAG: CDP-alcohol phosphatidyltransferase family protein [Microthrixaceae bacterium]